MKPSKKSKYKLDPKKFEIQTSLVKKKKDWDGQEVFNEILRSKLRRRH